jgi:hypothetical protein
MKHEILATLQQHLQTPGFRDTLRELAERGEEPSRSFADGLLRIAAKYDLLGDTK